MRVDPNRSPWWPQWRLPNLRTIFTAAGTGYLLWGTGAAARALSQSLPPPLPRTPCTPPSGPTRLLQDCVAQPTGLFDGQPLQAAPSNITMFGHTGLPRPQHVQQGALDDTGDSFFNAVAAGLARSAPATLQRRFAPAQGCNCSGATAVRLEHVGQPRTIAVDHQFYVADGGTGPAFLGNGYALSRGSDALWAALAEKAFIKLRTTYPETYLPAPGQIGSALLPDVACDGYAQACETLPRPVMQTLLRGALKEYDLSQIDTATLRDAMAVVKAGTAVGVLALLRDRAYVDARAFILDPFTDTELLRFADGTRCNISRFGTRADPACSDARGNEVQLRSGHAYVLYGSDQAGSNLMIHDSNFALQQVRGASPAFTRSTNKVFALPRTLAGQLNATLFIGSPEPPVAALASSGAMSVGQLSQLHSWLASGAAAYLLGAAL